MRYVVRHENGCNLAHPGPGWRAWLRWFFASVSCDTPHD